MLGREGCTCPEFAFKNDVVVGLCTTQSQVHPNYITTLNDVECILKSEEGSKMVDVKGTPKQMENWLGIPAVQAACTTPRPE